MPGAFDALPARMIGSWTGLAYNFTALVLDDAVFDGSDPVRAVDLVDIAQKCADAASTDEVMGAAGHAGRRLTLVPNRTRHRSSRELP